MKQSSTANFFNENMISTCSLSENHCKPLNSVEVFTQGLPMTTIFPGQHSMMLIIRMSEIYIILIVHFLSHPQDDLSWIAVHPFKSLPSRLWAYIRFVFFSSIESLPSGLRITFSVRVRALIIVYLIMAPVSTTANFFNTTEDETIYVRFQFSLLQLSNIKLCSQVLEKL